MAEGEADPDFIEWQRGEGVCDDGNQRLRRQCRTRDPTVRSIRPSSARRCGRSKFCRVHRPIGRVRVLRGEREEQGLAAVLRRVAASALRKARSAAARGQGGPMWRIVSAFENSSQYSSWSPSQIERTNSRALLNSTCAELRLDSRRLLRLPIEGRQSLANLVIGLQRLRRRHDHREVHVRLGFGQVRNGMRTILGRNVGSVAAWYRITS